MALVAGARTRAESVAIERSTSNCFGSITTWSAHPSTKLAASWIREEKLETALPNEPKITSGKIVASSNGVGA